MERRYINSIKEELTDMLIKNGDTERAIEIANAPLFSPILKAIEAHAEAEPNMIDINTMFGEIIYDLTILNSEFAISANSIKELMESTDTRLLLVKRNLLVEKERQQDINILCNKYSEFSSVVNLTDDYFEGNFSSNDDIFSAQIVNQSKVQYEIISIGGNGYEGNMYVYKDKEFLEDKLSTANRKFINDDSKITTYEYSRITASNKEKESFPEVNFDSIEARCTITLSSKVSFNSLKVSSSSSKISLMDIQTSNDGIEFKSQTKRTIAFNDLERKYDTFDYIAGSGIICFPQTKFLKIVLQSNEYTDDKIAFEKTEVTGIDKEGGN
jgi:hypothetical protein